MLVAIIVGILVGAVCCVPFEVARKKIRTVNPTNSVGLLGWFLMAIALSFVVLAAAMIACRFLAQSAFLPFALSSIATFVIVVIVFGLTAPKRK